MSLLDPVREVPLPISKFHVPSTRQNLVPRPDLVSLLDRALTNALTTVSAPAGSGKTTVLSEWVRHCDVPVAWISVDEDDNDAVRFLRLLVKAVSGVCGPLGGETLSLLRGQRSARHSLKEVSTCFINEIGDAVSDHLVLIMDDYHLIDVAAVHEMLSFLIERRPPTLHVIVAGRSEPLLPLARLRARGQLFEIGPCDLRFDQEEAQTLLQTETGRRFPLADVAILTERTEGWPAGLQLAALSLRDRDTVEASAFVRTFRGTNRYVWDYLVDEVFRRQSESVQHFLLHTAILRRLTGALCDAVLSEYTPAQKDGATMLERLMRDNLFLVPLDEERRWYRYHHLFADVIRRRLEETYPDRLRTLHRRAGRWYADHGLFSDAIRHAIDAADVELAAALIEQASDEVLQRGEFTRLQEWLNVLPDAVIRARPHLCLASAWVAVSTGELDAVESYLRTAESFPSKQKGGNRSAPDSDAALSGDIALVRSTVALRRGEITPAITSSRAAYEHFGAFEGNEAQRSTAALNLGLAYRIQGELEAARAALTDALTGSRSAGDTYGYLSALSALANVHVLQGRLRAAERVYRQALAVAEEHGGVLLGGPLVGLGRLAYEWNDLDAAARYLEKALVLHRRAGNFTGLRGGYILQAHITFARGDSETTSSALDSAERIAYESGSPLDVARVLAWKAKFWLAGGNVSAATRWAHDVRRTLPMPPDTCEAAFLFTHEAIYRSVVRVELFQDVPDARHVLRLLAPFAHIAEATGRMNNLIGTLVLQARAYQVLGDVDRALDSLKRALTLAQPANYVRMFLDEGTPLAKLLGQAESQDVFPRYVRTLLDAFPPDAVQDCSSTPTPLEPLTDREREVLALLATGLPGREIADQLSIAVGTVYWHSKNIYHKLDVDNRSTAVARARTLGILS